jgi:hypothetical protein
VQLKYGVQFVVNTVGRWSAALILLAVSFPASAACERLQVVNGELWTTTEGARTRLVRDARGVIAPAWSPRGDSIAYGRNGDFDLDAAPEVVLIDGRGGAVRTLALPAESPVNAIMEVGWRDAEHVWAIGHVNPSTSMLLEWDAGSGRLLNEEAGAKFVLSPNGRYFAHQTNVPHGAPPPFDTASLVINGNTVWPSGESERRLSGLPVWSADSVRLAFLATGGDTTDLVIVDPSGRQLSDVSIEIDDLEVRGWDGDAVILANEDEALRVTLSGTVEKIEVPVGNEQASARAERCTATEIR